MGTTAKVFLGILFVLSVAYLALSTAAFSIRTNWHQKFSDLNKQYEASIVKWNAQRESFTGEIKAKEDLIGVTSQENNGLKTRVDEKIGQITALEQQITLLETQVNSQNNLMAAKESAIADKDKVISGLQKDLADANGKITSITNERNDFKAAELSAKTQYEAEKSRSKTLELQNIDAVKKIQELETTLNTLVNKGVDVEAIVQNTAPLLEGRVLDVDPNLNLVMISLGVDDKVKPGYHFYAHRNGEYVGEIVIDKVDTDAAFGRIVPSGTPRGKLIQSGDNVTTQLGS